MFCYNDGMTEIEELIEAAKKVLKEWRPPSREPPEHQQAKSWRQVLEERKVPLSLGRRG